MGSVKRSYHSDVRRRAAEETRRAIVAAARGLFASQGFAATSIDAIAREAGVAAQTVYAVFGNKRALLLALGDAIDDEAEVGRMRAAFATGTPVGEQRRAVARFFTQLFTRGGDVIEAARGAGAADPELRLLMLEGVKKHHREGQRVAAAWARAGALRPGLSTRDAGDTLATITSYPVFAELQIAGWSPKRYERWLNDAIDRLVLTSDA